MRRSKGEGAIYRRKTGAKKGLWVAEYKAGSKKKYLYGKTKKAVADKLRDCSPLKRRISLPRPTTCVSTSTSTGDYRRSGAPSRSGPGPGTRRW